MKGSFTYIFSLIILVGAIYITVVKPGGQDATSIAGTLVYTISAIFAAVMGYLSFHYYRSNTPQGRIAGWLTLSIIINAVAGLVLLYSQSVYGARIFLVDALAILAYLPSFVGLSYGWWKTRNLAYPERTFGFLVAWLLLVAVTYTSLISPLITDPTANAITKFLNTIYPSFDLLLVLLGGILTLALWGGAFTAPWGLIFMGIFSLAFGNLTFAYLSWQGFYSIGHVSDLFWIGGFVLIAAGFHFQRHAVQRKRKKR